MRKLKENHKRTYWDVVVQE